MVPWCLGCSSDPEEEQWALLQPDSRKAGKWCSRPFFCLCTRYKCRRLHGKKRKYSLGKHLRLILSWFLEAHYAFIKTRSSFELTMQQCIVKCTPDVPVLAPTAESLQCACQGDVGESVCAPLITNASPSKHEAVTESLTHCFDKILPGNSLV